jgi:tellurite resistance protein TehA-like permease
LWKHVANKLPLNYEPVMWSFVFPLGMYAVASVRLGLAADFPPLQWISQIMIWVAFVAWMFTLAGVIRRVLRRGSGSPS